MTSLSRFTPLTEVWTRIQRISGRFSSAPLPVLRVNNRDIIHPSDVAEVIAGVLSERCRGGQNVPQSTTQTGRRELETVDFLTVDRTDYNEPFTMAELASALSSLKSVSEGLDGVHNDMLRRLPAAAQEALLATLNSLWETDTFPAAWREATVISILKPGKSGLDPLHYRPISLTSSLCKVMEKMVNVRLTCQCASFLNTMGKMVIMRLVFLTPWDLYKLTVRF